MGQYSTAIEQLYVAYFNRPADRGGLEYWDRVISENAGSLQQVSAAFATSPEYLAAFAGMSRYEIVDQVYINLFGRHAEADGLLYWTEKLQTGALTLPVIVTAISSNAVGSDAVAFAAKTRVATAFTNALDTTIEMLSYSGSAVFAAAKNMLAGVVDEASMNAVLDNLDAIVEAILLLLPIPWPTNFTVAQDRLTGLPGNDNFTSQNSDSVQTLNDNDVVDGGAGTDRVSIVSTGGKAYTMPSVSMKNIEQVRLLADAAVTVDAQKWWGVNTLEVNSSGGASITANESLGVIVNEAKMAGQKLTVSGAESVAVNADGASNGQIAVEAAAWTRGSVTITLNDNGTGEQAGAIAVAGGAAIIVKQSATNAVNTTHTNAAVSVIADLTTDSVRIEASAAAQANAMQAGVIANTVSIVDSLFGAGMITDLVLSGYGSTGFDGGGALKNLTLMHGKSDVVINNFDLNRSSSAKLNLQLDDVTGGLLQDAGMFTDLSIHTTGSASRLDNIKMDGVRYLTLSGNKDLTLAASDGLGQLHTVKVTGSAGLIADLSHIAVRLIDTSVSSGNMNLMLDAKNASFIGGSGNDHVQITSSVVKQVLNLGAGNDVLEGVSSAPFAAINGGAGTDILQISATIAASSSLKSGIFNSFEHLRLSDSTNQSVDLSKFDGLEKVFAYDASNLSLNHFGADTILELTGAGTSYNIGSANYATGKNDHLFLNLYNGSQKDISFASSGVSAPNVETIYINNIDPAAGGNLAGDGKPPIPVPTSTSYFNSINLSGNSAHSIHISGNVGIALTSKNAELTLVDASSMVRGGLLFTSGQLHNAASIKGSFFGENVIDASAARASVELTGGIANDTLLANNAQNNSIISGRGDNIVSVGNGNNTIRCDVGNDVITVGSGNNLVETGYGHDQVNITRAGANLHTFTTIGAARNDVKITLPDWGVERFASGGITLGTNATLQDYANAAVAHAGNASVDAVWEWFQYGGDTYLLQSRHDGSSNASFAEGSDILVRLVGIHDLSHAELSGQSLTVQ